ncbi:MAG: acyl-CoA carboxylase epsilon subunit [Euzebya sp.]
MRIVIKAGTPSDQEIAAVVSAVAALAAHRQPQGDNAVPAWGRAARFEALGQAPFNSARDARLQHRGSGALPPVAERPASS